MEQAFVDEIIDEAIPGGGFNRAGAAALRGGVWTIPFRHFELGLEQIFVPGREAGNVSDRRTLATEIGERLGLAVASSR